MKYFALALLLIAVLLWGCTDEQDDGLISIEIHFDPGSRLQPMTMAPDMPLAVTEYRVYGSGPVSASFDMMVGGSACVVEDILPGEWVIVAEGFNSEGTMLLTGGKTVIIDKELSDITIQLTEPGGEGALRLSFSWEADLVGEPVLDANLTLSGGTNIPLSPTVSDSTAVMEMTVISGLYELTARLYDGDEQVAGAADYVKIIPGEETAGLIVFNVVLTPVSPGVILDVPYLTPLDVSITGYETPLFTGTPVTLRGTTAPAILSSFKWFVDSVQVAAGEEYCPETSAAGTKRIDLLADSDGYASGGSTTLEVSVYDPIFYGSLVFIESVFDNQEGTDSLSGVRALAIWGDYLYAAGYGEDEIGVFEIAESTGKLIFKNTMGAGDVPVPEMFDGPSCIAAGAAGTVVGCAGSGAILLLASNDLDGTLSYQKGKSPLASEFTLPAGGPPDLSPDVNPLAGVSAVAVTPDGDMLFASSSAGDTITSYTVVDGVITPYQIVSSGTIASQGFSDGLLDGPEEIAASNNGSLLATACRFSDSLVIFSIDESDTLLTPIYSSTDGVDGTDGINGAAGLCFSPDGNSIYVTGYYDDAVALFVKNEVTGAWRFETSWNEDDFAGTALHYPRGITVSPDGSEVYICAGGSDALTVFSRDGVTGFLSNPTSAVNGDDRNVGLDGIRKVVATGESGYVYAVSSNDNAAVLFRRE